MRLPDTWNRKESGSKLVEKTISRIRFEIGQVDHLLQSYADLLEQVRHQPPTLVEATAVASVLHSFYNGLESIFLTIAKDIDADVPTSAHWHRDLLTQMTKGTSKRGPVLTTKTYQRLASYLGFRHFYRHSYSFFLAWDELEDLVTPLQEFWGRVKSELESFVDSMSAQ